MAIATIAQLEAELIEAVKTVPAFSDSGFSVFDLGDFEDQSSAGQTLPCVGVSYAGSEPTGGNEVTPTTKAHSVVLRNVQFVVVVAAQYRYTAQDDTKQEVFALLDQVRAVLLGLKGVNSRPWRFIVERPEPEASGDGVIFYSQVWQTTLPIVGNFNSTQ